MFGILISNTQSLKCKIITYDAVKCSWRRVQHKLLDAQVVVNAQFEDRIRARICPGDSLKRAGLFIHVLCRGGCVYMLCVCICVYMHHYDRHQSSRGTQGTGAPKRGTCPLLHLITTVIYYYDTLAAKDPKQRECKSFLLSLLLCSYCCSCCCCCGCCC